MDWTRWMLLLGAVGALVLWYVLRKSRLESQELAARRQYQGLADLNDDVVYQNEGDSEGLGDDPEMSEAVDDLLESMEQFESLFYFMPVEEEKTPENEERVNCRLSVMAWQTRTDTSGECIVNFEIGLVLARRFGFKLIGDNLADYLKDHPAEIA